MSRLGICSVRDGVGSPDMNKIGVLGVLASSVANVTWLDEFMCSSSSHARGAMDESPWHL